MYGVLKNSIIALCLLVALWPAVGHAADKKVLLVFGDSLVAGYGLKQTEALPEQLEARLIKEGLPVKVYNSGVSGDTTTSALNRLEYALRIKPDYVLIVLGGNDMMRGIDPAITRENLRRMMEKLKDRRIPVMLAGMNAFGIDSNQTAIAYSNMYKNLAKQYDAVLYPFILKDVAMKPELNQQDGIHPTAEGVKIIVNNLLPSVAELLVREPGEKETSPEPEEEQ